MPEQHHLVMTGGNSGIGLEAAELLLQAGHRLTVICRTAATAAALRQRLAGSLHTVIADLADLESVARCAHGLLAAGVAIDTLVLNAGLQYSGASQPRWSHQGFELTLAVNHLAHQALLQQLLPLLRQAPTPKVVVTASEVHDPATPGGGVGSPAGLGDLSGLRRGPGAPMLDGSSRFNADKAYKDSKLCNLLMALELHRREQQQGSALQVLAWSPGLVIPRSEGGFFRYSRRHNPVGQALFALIARDLLRVTATPHQAGSLLAALASEAHAEPSSFHYWSNRVVGPGQLRFERRAPSAEASNPELAAALWTLSAGWAGLEP